MPSDHREALRKIRTFPQLVAYLRDEMRWPIGKDDFEELTFEYTAEELGIDPKSAAKIQKIRQLRPFVANQPWGIFFVEFEPRQLPVVALRHILGSIAVKKRATTRAAAQQMWHANDLLFVSNYGMGDERRIAFAHFAVPTLDRELPTLKVLGWDGDDTPLHLDKVAHQLITSLSYSADTPVQEWSRRWRSAFTLDHGEVIRSSKELASRLAHLASAIRRTVKAKMAIEDKSGPLRSLMESFRTALIHDLDEEGFADTYAQTITYGLLSTRIINPEGSTPDDLAGHLRTSPFLKELMEQFLKVGGRKGRAGGPGIDFDELGIGDVQALLDRTQWDDVLRDFGDRNRDQDPVMHFFEGFLHEYDRKIKKDRGVFYTPQPVVSYIVRSVHELLQTEFGLEDGLADTTTWGEMLKKHPDLKLPRLSDDPKSTKTVSPDEPFVQVLDPATGTATFLVEVIEVIQRTLAAKWKQQRLTDAQQRAAWNEYVPRNLLPRLHAFELMMAPYAIAHMKIGLKLAETGYRFGTEERARIYLTNALEPWVKQLPLIGFDALAHEAAAVNDIKRSKRFTVVIGNPPYSGISSNMSEEAQHLVDAYRVVDGAALNERKLWLQDDYVKFIRKAQTTIEQAGIGIVGYITNHGYLDNPTFRGMRQSLLHSFRKLYVLDAHGNALKKERAPDGSEDKNIFEIRQGVAICVAAKHSSSKGTLRSDLWGSREAKYEWLSAHSQSTTHWDEIAPASPFYFFRPTDSSTQDYFKWPQLSELMPTYTSGVITARDELVLDFEPGPILERVALLRDERIADETIRLKLFEGKSSPKYTAGDSRGWKLPVARKRLQADGQWRERVANCMYRPFDRRCVYLTEWMVDWSRPELRRHLALGKNPVLVFPRNTGAGKPWDHAFVSNEPILGRFFPDSACITYMAPALVITEGVFGGAAGIAANVKGACSGGHMDPVAIRNRALAEFGYIYSILHSPTYRELYATHLRADFPRIPGTGDEALRQELTALGSDLVALHLLESPRLDRLITTYTGKQSQEVGRVGWSNGTVWLDASATRKGQTATSGAVGFRGVPAPVWNFQVGGYQVCEKWLKDRKGRTLSQDDIFYYQKIVVAIAETIRLMKEIDEVIEKYGGWPGAFQAADSAGTATERLLRVAERPAEYGSDHGEGEG